MSMVDTAKLMLELNGQDDLKDLDEVEQKIRKQLETETMQEKDQWLAYRGFASIQKKKVFYPEFLTKTRQLIIL